MASLGVNFCLKTRTVPTRLPTLSLLGVATYTAGAAQSTFHGRTPTLYSGWESTPPLLCRVRAGIAPFNLHDMAIFARQGGTHIPLGAVASYGICARCVYVKVAYLLEVTQPLQVSPLKRLLVMCMHSLCGYTMVLPGCSGLGLG